MTPTHIIHKPFSHKAGSIIYLLVNAVRLPDGQIDADNYALVDDRDGSVLAEDWCGEGRWPANYVLVAL